MPREPESKYHIPLTRGRGVLKHSCSENTKSLLIQGILSITLFETSNDLFGILFGEGTII